MYNYITHSIFFACTLIKPSSGPRETIKAPQKNSIRWSKNTAEAISLSFFLFIIFWLDPKQI